MSASLSELEAQRDRLKRQLSDVGNLRLEVWWSVTASAANRIAIALSLTIRYLTNDLVEVNEMICETRIVGGQTEGAFKKRFTRRGTGSRHRR